MQPIIHRTITITITETWTITWADGQETTWQETQEVVWPVDSEHEAALPAVIDDDERDRGWQDDDNPTVVAV